MNLDRVTSGIDVPNDFNVIIEIPMNADPIKYEVDKVTGAVFVEKIFGWHGMGEWVVTGIATQDTNIVAAITVFSGAVVLLAGLLSDVIYAILDPRVRVT